MQSSDPYQKMITALQHAKPSPADAASITNVIIEAVEKEKVSIQKSKIYYLFRNVTVSAAAMLVGLFLYQTVIVAEEQSYTKQSIALNVDAPVKQPLINRKNLAQSLITYIINQKKARDNYRKQFEDYTFNTINKP